LCITDASVILCGDFNLPQIDWSSLDNGPDLLSNSLVDCMQENALVQYVSDPTRGSNILDLVFTNDPFLLRDVNVNAPLRTSDHDRVDFKLNFCSTVFLKQNDKVFTDYSAVNWDSFNEHLRNIDWSCIYSGVANDGNERWSTFASTFHNVILQFAPTTIKQVRKSAARSYPCHIRKLISKKAFLWKKGKNFQYESIP